MAPPPTIQCRGRSAGDTVAGPPGAAVAGAADAEPAAAEAAVEAVVGAVVGGAALVLGAGGAVVVAGCRRAVTAPGSGPVTSAMAASPGQAVYDIVRCPVMVGVATVSPAG